MTSPHWREKAREALTRGAHRLEIPLAEIHDLRHSERVAQLCNQLVDAVAAALQSAYEAGERDGDHARREFAALEWLATTGYPVRRCPDTGLVRVLDHPPATYDTWADAARDCGWEEK